MRIKIHTKIILLLIVFQAFAVARYDTINEEHICTAAKFIMNEDDQRQSKFNAVSAASLGEPEGEQNYRPHTVAINAKINGKVNTGRKASMETKRAVTLAILGTALTENGDTTEITDKFNVEEESLKAQFPENYQTNILYLHRLALHTIEVLANSFVKGALDATVDTHFRNLTSLTGIKRDAFMELFDMAQLAHQAGLEAQKKPSDSVHTEEKQDDVLVAIGSGADAMETGALVVSILPVDHLDDTSAVSMDIVHTEEKKDDDVPTILIHGASAMRADEIVQPMTSVVSFEPSSIPDSSLVTGTKTPPPSHDAEIVEEEDAKRGVNPDSYSATTALSTAPSSEAKLNVPALGMPSGGATPLPSSTTRVEEDDSKSETPIKGAPAAVASEYNWTETFKLSDGREVRREPGKITVYAQRSNKKTQEMDIDSLKIQGRAAHKIIIPVKSTREDFVRLLEQTKLYGQTTSTPPRVIDRRASTGSVSLDSAKGDSAKGGSGKGGSGKDTNESCVIC